MAIPKVESTTDAPPKAEAESDERGWRPYRLSVRQYLRMIDAGVFPPETHVELLGGILVEQMTKGHPRNYLTMILPTIFQPLLPRPWAVVGEVSLRLGPRSRPEPDLMILQGPIPRYKGQPPTPHDVALVVEVAESSYRYDRSHKWRSYAAAGIPVYWIINLKKRQVEVYRDPAGAGAGAEYRTSEVYGEDAAAPVVIAGVEVGRVAARDILP